MSDFERMEGLFVGQLDEYETWLFNCAVEDGMAYSDYSGAAGFLGLAKVGLHKRVAPPLLGR